MMRTAHFVWAANAALLSPVQSLAPDARDIAQGLELAQQVCSQCHAVEKKQARSPNNAAPRFETIASVPGMTGLSLSAALQRSHRIMPDLNLDRIQRRIVIAYILSLK
jgi:cytochrome c